MASERRAVVARRSVSGHDGAAALVITADEGDRLSIAAALAASCGELRFAEDLVEARAAMAAESIPVVVVDGDALAPCWRELLEQIPRSETGAAPQFIVVSRRTDERLWAEVLNLGGYDLLPKPLEAEQVSWVVQSALPEWNRARDWARPG